MTELSKDAFAAAATKINLAVREAVADVLPEVIEEAGKDDGEVAMAAIAGMISAAGGFCALFSGSINGDVVSGVVQQQFDQGRADQLAMEQEDVSTDDTPSPLPGLPGSTSGTHDASEGEKDKLFTTVQALRATLARCLPEPMDYLQVGMTAGMILSGGVYAAAVLSGVETDTRQRRRQVERMLKTNFDAGKNIGFNAGSRMAREQGKSN